MIDIGGVTYKINLEKISDLLVSDDSLDSKEITETDVKEIFDEENKFVGKEVYTKTYTKNKEFDAARFDVIGSLFNIILGYNEEMDGTLGLERALQATPLPFKIAFNTLLDYGILVEIEE